MMHSISNSHEIGQMRKIVNIPTNCNMDLSLHTKKGTLWVSCLWFFKCACESPNGATDKRFFFFAQSLLKVCEQKSLHRDCVNAQA